MHPNNLLKQVDFIKEIDKLKYIQRKTKLFNSDRHENDAEHSWHLAMMTIVLAEHADKPIDVFKVLKMVLIHDIVEIDAGDTFIYDTQKNHTNTEEELLAAERIFGLLPTEQAAEFIAIWKEFEDGITDEAKFAKAMDRFEPLLQNTSNNGGTWAEFNVPYQKVYDKKKTIKNGSTSIWNYAEHLINESVEKGILKKALTETEALDNGPFYHGTKADLEVGDLLTAGFRSNYRPEVIMNHIYFTALPNGAGLAASLAAGDGDGRVYIVEPTGSFENDPNVTDKKFPGNPTRSYRSAAPLKIVGEVTDWVRLTPEELQIWREKLANIKANPAAVIIN